MVKPCADGNEECTLQHLPSCVCWATSDWATVDHISHFYCIMCHLQGINIRQGATGQKAGIFLFNLIFMILFLPLFIFIWIMLYESRQEAMWDGERELNGTRPNTGT